MSKRILIYHPKVFYRTFIGDLLKKEGIDCEAFESVNLLLKSMSENTPQGIIVDVEELGDKDLAFIEFVRKKFPQVAVIVVIGGEKREYASRYLKMGAIDCIEKPIKKEELLSAVRKISNIEKQRKENINPSVERLMALSETTERLSKIARKKIPIKLSYPQSELVQSILDTILMLFNAEKVSLSWLDMDKRKYYVIACSGLCEDISRLKPKAMGEGIIGYVADKKEAVLVKDISRDVRFSESPYKRQYKSGSFMCGPIFLDGDVVATISVSDKKDRSHFTEEDLFLFKSFLNQLSYVFKTNLLMEELEKNTKRFELYYELSDHIINLVESNEILSNLISSVLKHFLAEGGAIYIIDENREFIVKESSLGLRFKERVQFYEHVSEFLSQIQISLNSKDLTRLIETLFLEEKISNAITIPIFLKSFPLGFLVIINSRLKDFDENMLMDLSRLFSVAIKNDWLYKNLNKTVDELVETNKKLTLLMKKYKENNEISEEI